MTAVRLIAYAPNGASLGPLPEPDSISASYVLSDAGALSIGYHPDAARSNLLGQPLEIATEVSTDNGLTWTEPPNGRYLYLRDGRDPIKTGDLYQIEAPSYAWRLQKALVGTAGLDANGQRSYEASTPGAILIDLLVRAQARGALSGLTGSWSATNDTNGTPWPSTQSISYDPGANLLAVLQGMVESGWVDFRTRGRILDIYVSESPDGLAQDKTVIPSPVSLRYGRDLTEAPFRRTWEGLADTAVVLGDEGNVITRINPAALKPWGVQETFVTASGVTDGGTLSTLGDAALQLTESVRTEHTFGITFGGASFLPFRDYSPGDWVYAATSGTAAPERMRLRQVTLTRDSSGAMGGNVVLNDRFLEAEVLQARRIAKLTAGATQGGSGTTPSGVGPDILAPKQAVGLTAGSAAYADPDGAIRSQITLNWDDVTTNADNTPTADVAGYEVWGRIPTVFDWRMEAATTLSQWSNSPYEPGQTWEFKVRAVDTSYNFGAFSIVVSTTTALDATPPPVPSAPVATSRLGTARIAWDGLNSVGAAMTATTDWRYVTVHVSTVSGFTPTAANRVGDLTGAGYVIAGPLNYSTTYYARLVAWDSSDNASAASAQVAIVVMPLVDVSNFPDDAMEELYARTGHFLDLTADNFSANLIEGAWVKAGAITADKLTVGAQTGDNLIPNGDFQDLNVAATLPLMWSTTVRDGAGGTLGVETALAINGTRSGKVTLATSADGAYLWSTPVPAAPGVTVVVEVRFRVNVAISGIPVLTLSTSTSGTDPRDFPGANVTWDSHFNLASPPANTVVVLRKQMVIPANRNQMALMVALPPHTGGGYTAIVDGGSVTYAVTDAMVTDIGAGKIRTGILQATERIIAGTLTGARAELNGVGFQAFAPDGRKMFEVQANSGEVAIGDSSGGNVYIRMGAFNNPWAGINQGLIRFVNAGSSWGDGQITSEYFTDGSATASLRMTSPYNAGLGGGIANAAWLDLRSNAAGGSAFYLKAQQSNFSGNTFIWGSGDGSTVDFRDFGSGGFQFSDFGQTSRLRLIPQSGLFTLRGADVSGNVQQLRLQGLSISLSAGGQELYMSTAGTIPAFGHFEKNVVLEYTNGALRVVNYLRSGFLPILASAFTVSSDPRMKSDAEPVQPGALKAVRALTVYDYGMEGALPRRALKGPKMAKVIRPDGEEVRQFAPERNRARGVMADQVKAILPDAVHQDTEGRLSVNLYDLLATTMAAVQELADQVDRLEADR